MESKNLEEFGLTKNEAIVYKALLELRSSLAGQIARKTGLHRRTVYDVTEMLIQKGLIGYMLKNNRRLFSASSPERFMDIVKENSSIGAHSLILVDIGLKFEDALLELEKASHERGIKLDKIVVCSRMGLEDKNICYGKLEELRSRKVKSPFCFIIPGKMHFVEGEVLKKQKDS